MIAAAAPLERLRAVAGADAARAATDADAVHGVRPEVVVAPRDASACAALLATCSEHGWSVEVAGGRSARGAGRVPGRVVVLLSTERLRGVVEYEPDDLTVGVAGGTQLDALRARVAAHRQRVPLDAGGTATVGGVLARAAAGPMRQSWSTPRRQTLGIELVTGDGRVLRVGGRVVKNVAGYDLNKLVVGSHGTLGVVTHAHLRLLPVPVAAATLEMQGRDVGALCAAARALLAHAVQPAALEIVSGAGIDGGAWRLLARYEGASDYVHAGIDALREAAAAAGALVAEADDALDRLAARERGAAIVVRVADLPDRLEQTLTRARAIADDATLAAHAGAGIARVLLPGASRSPGAAGADALARAIERARADFGGTVVVERGTPELMCTVDPWGQLDDIVLRLTRELRRQFDPAGILQRGRWIA